MLDGENDVRILAKVFARIKQFVTICRTGFLHGRLKELPENPVTNYLPRYMVRVWSHKRRFPGSPHFCLQSIFTSDERVILETHNSLNHSNPTGKTID